MSAQTASWHGAGPGKRLLSMIAPGETRPVRLTIRRVKFAGSLFVGALMLGVVSNAMLLQPAASLRVVGAAPQQPDVATFPPPRETAPPVHDKAPGPPAAALARTADPMPVGSIAAASRPKPHPTAVASKSRPHRSDTIGDFLKAGKIR